VELIDMEQHTGGHPRMGAVDVIPFLPIRDVTMDDCVALAREVGRELADTLNLPVYLYDQAALTPDRSSLAAVRKGEFEGLKADVARGERLPDFGPHEIGKAGAVAVGARKPLVAFNVYLDGGAEDEDAAKAIAKAVRETSGGLKNVRAIGFYVPERDCVTVSMNLVDTGATPIHRAFELVKVEASRFGLAVLDTEIVGLSPQGAIATAAEHYLQLRGFDPAEQIIENLVARANTGSAAADTAPSTIAGSTVVGFLGVVASDAPTPGGGSVSAVCGAAGAALIAMVGRLTIGRKGFEDVSERMEEIVNQADESRAALLALADRDAAAFDSVMAAIRMPKESEEEKAARSAALQRATAEAAAAPMEVARRSTPLMDLAVEVVEKGNPNAASDGATAAAVLHASVQGALANVEINLSSLKDPDEVARMRSEVDAIRRQAEEQLAAAQQAFARTMSG
jgi:glutamate formiminotransferase/formiminotetrahydrofolate cyclodeaminase